MNMHTPLSPQLSPSPAAGRRDRRSHDGPGLNSAESRAAANGLAAAPPSEGARRLAWWIAGEEARVELLIAVTGWAPALIDRLLEGEVVPEGELGAAIAHGTEGAVRPDDWERPATGGWADEPAVRAANGKG